jgi:hypothetical protein
VTYTKKDLAINGGPRAKSSKNYPMFPGGLEIGEEEKKQVLEVLDSKYLFRYYGPSESPSKVKALEESYARHTGSRHALALNSCTSALISALVAAGVGPGDEVIVPSYTFFATCAAVVAAQEPTGSVIAANPQWEKIKSLVGEGYDLTSCFISYSSQDGGFAQRLCSDLRASGVRAWSAPEDPSDKFHASIDEARRRGDKLVVVLSDNSIDSAWVEKEVETAFEKERQQKRTMLFPVRLDDAIMKTDQAWAADIRRTRHIGDMSNWKDHDSYQKAFERLLRDLQSESAKS